MKKYVLCEDYSNEGSAFDADPIVRRSVAMVTKDQDLIDIYKNDPDLEVRSVIVKNPNMPTSQAVEYAFTDPEYLVPLVERSDVSSDTLARVWEYYNTLDAEDIPYDDWSDDLLWPLLTHPNLPASVIQDVLESGDVWLIEALVANPNIPYDVLLDCATNDAKSYSSIRWQISKRDDASEELLNILKDDDDSSVRMHVISNPNVTEDILLYLTEDYNSGVRDNAIATYVGMTGHMPPEED